MRLYRSEALRAASDFDPANSPEGELFGFDFVNELVPASIAATVSNAVNATAATVSAATSAITTRMALSSDVPAAQAVAVQVAAINAAMASLVSQYGVATGEVVTGVESFTINLVSGSDPDYSLRLLAAPTYDGTVVSCLVGGLQPGCRYGLAATAITSLGHTKTLGSYVNGEQL